MGNMINVTVGNNTSRQTLIVADSKTLREIFDEAEVVYASASVNIDGCPLNIGDMDKTLAEMGVKDKCYLIAVTKTNNA